jgi:hypothetical protein
MLSVIAEAREAQSFFKKISLHRKLPYSFLHPLYYFLDFRGCGYEASSSRTTVGAEAVLLCCILFGP